MNINIISPDFKSPWVEYDNGNYHVSLNLIDGTKIRTTEDDFFRAEFPESMDVKITNQCDKMCPWCHENSTPTGIHGDLTVPMIDSFRPGQEIAVGGGNVLSHPDLIPFLERLKENGCVPSITLNQTHFLENLEVVSALKRKKLIYGIGVSLVKADAELVLALKRFPTAVLHVIAGILTQQELNSLIGNDLKMLILGYKDIRRGEAWHAGSHGAEVDENIKMLAENLDVVFNGFKVASFDNLALEQLPVRKYLGEDVWERFYMGDDGQHTFYIDMVEQEYALSSTSKKRFPIGDKMVDAMFKHILNSPKR